jgi:hypothetical protein
MVAIIGLDVATVTLICEEATAKSGEPISIANYLVDGNYAVSGKSILLYEACMSMRMYSISICIQALNLHALLQWRLHLRKELVWVILTVCHSYCTVVNLTSLIEYY